MKTTSEATLAKARELLAAEYERAGQPGMAEVSRNLRGLNLPAAFLAIVAALESVQPALAPIVADGYVVVPIVPTDEMLTAPIGHDDN